MSEIMRIPELQLKNEIEQKVKEVKELIGRVNDLTKELSDRSVEVCFDHTYIKSKIGGEYQRRIEVSANIKFWMR